MNESFKHSESYILLMVTFNRAKTLSEILWAIKKYEWTFSHFVIVDNSSYDSTAEVLHSYSNDSRFIIVKSVANIGHGAGLSLGLREIDRVKLDPEYIVFLEDDSIPHQELPDILRKKIVSSGFDLISPAGFQVRVGSRIQLQPQHNEILRADFCLFDGAIIRYTVIKKIGYPMEEWFMMADDYEYCYRIRLHGFKIGVIQNSFHEILHLGGGGRFTPGTRWRGYYQMRNHVFFLRKYFNLFHLVDFFILQGKRFFASFIPSDRMERIRLRLIGLWHGIINKNGRRLDQRTFSFKVSEVRREKLLIPGQKGASSKVFLLLSSKSSGSSALQRFMILRYGFKTLPVTPHYENETLYWTKAASVLGMDQHRMHRSVVPYPASEGKVLLNELLEKNNLESAEYYTEQLIFDKFLAMAQKNKPLFFEKSPHHLFNLSNLELICKGIHYVGQQADCHIIALIRNPLDTIYSAWSRWKYNCKVFEREWYVTYSNLEVLRTINPKLAVFRYEDLANDLAPLENYCHAAGLSPLVSDFVFNKSSIRKWEKDSSFRHTLSLETIELAQRFGYSAESMISEQPDFSWAINEYLRNLWYGVKKFGRGEFVRWS